MWFDSHCHLHLCESTEPPSAFIERAGLAGVTGILTAGIDLESSERSLSIAEAAPGVFATAGIHPNSARGWETSIEAIDGLLSERKVVAVGESGLDFYRDYVDEATQRACFAAHIDLAKKHRKALVIHTRESVEAALSMLENAGPPEKLIFHCWSGDEGSLRRALDLGAYVSFAGNVSFKSADDLRLAARSVPDDRILVETDSPYLTPVPHRGKANEPRMVAFVGVAVAKAREVSVHLLADRTSQNARVLFGSDV